MRVRRSPRLLAIFLQTDELQEMRWPRTTSQSDPSHQELAQRTKNKAYRRESHKNAQAQLKARPLMIKKPARHQSGNQSCLALTVPWSSVTWSVPRVGIILSAYEASAKTSTAAPHFPLDTTVARNPAPKEYNATIKTITPRTALAKPVCFAFTVPLSSTARGVSRLGIIAQSSQFHSSPHSAYIRWVSSD